MFPYPLFRKEKTLNEMISVKVAIVGNWNNLKSKVKDLNLFQKGHIRSSLF